MSNAVYVSLSQQMVLRKQIDAVAQNLANMNTAGFKNERVIFEEYLHEATGGDPVSYVHEVGLQRDLTQGNIDHTDSDLDIALDGAGYFVVQTDDGPRYTRQGHLQIDELRQIVTSRGDPLIGDSEEPITLNDDARNITITKDGTISSENGPIGKFQVVAFDDERALIKAGNGLFISDQQPIPADPEKFYVVQGALEASNVEPILEMTRMIEVLRSYQTTQKMVGTDHELRRKAIRDIPAVS